MDQKPNNVGGRSKNLTILSLNIRNPSIERAKRQARWLHDKSADIFVLTECKGSEGCSLLANYFQCYGYNVEFPEMKNKEYGVLIASKFDLERTEFSDRVSYLSSRVVSVKVNSFRHRLEIIGVYVPSRGFNNKYKERKKRFLRKLSAAFQESINFRSTVFCGDLNILEPDHKPHYPGFEEWEYESYREFLNHSMIDAFRHLYPNAREYSWIGRVGHGYRYDHCFVSSDLLHLVQNCYYIHEPREEKLSDHAAMITELVIR